jgi:hypothetical protein
MMALANVPTLATPMAPTTDLVQCRFCSEVVKPVLMARTSVSHRSNIPGVFGQYKQIPCCPKCGEKNP